MAKRLILCDCEGSFAPDAARIAAATGVSCSRVHTALCTRQADRAAALMAAAAGKETGAETGAEETGAEAIVACTQERTFFAELAAEAGMPVPGFVDLRDRAGWSDEGDRAGPKMAALVAEALLPAPEVPAMDVVSAGTCLIAGPGAVAEPLARLLAPGLAVTLLLTDGPGAADADGPDAADLLPTGRDFDVVTGRLRRVTGALGGFAIRIDRFRRIEPGGRGAFRLSPPQDGVRSSCDIVVDLTGGAPLVPAPEKREGYLRADPRDPGAVAAAGIEAVQLVGTFEKPLHVRLEPSLCAHSRAGQAGCSRCLDSCPTGAIAPAGDHVKIDPMVCAGCGGCAALCPSMAIAYEAPPLADLLRRTGVLAQTFREAGGGAPRLLVHDRHGAEMIRLGARFGRGLPAAVIPLELPSVGRFGHAEMLAALAQGFASVEVLISPATERDALVPEVALAGAIAGPGRVALIEETDPEALCARLYAARPPAPVAEPVLAMGGRRQIARLAARALNPGAGAPLPLPAGAPYGAVEVDAGRCTLCLSCVSLCPAGALLDNPDRPQLRFQENACLQCGICVSACPEDAISLLPRLDPGDGALAQRILHEEEPFACVECGRPFGVRSTIERIAGQLAGSHPMFADPARARLIRMCDDCRVKAQFRQGDGSGGDAGIGARPRPRTTEDYYSRRRDH